MNIYEQNHLMPAAYAIEFQAAQNPGIGMPLDPEVAAYLGAFAEPALCLEDLAEDSLLCVNEQGEVFYVGADN